jgi:8-oxo-dGTP pyrophosphatase MutT (NUDIX family)
MTRTLHKVTCFITRQGSLGRELLLIHHPNAGVQITAGTVEPGEDPEAAARREAGEESGLSRLRLVRTLGQEDEEAAEGTLFIARNTTVYSRPEANSFDWAHLRTGLQVEVLRRAAGFTQVCYAEKDDALDPHYTTYEITGWVPDETLTDQRTRHFYLFETEEATSRQWSVAIDHHVFELFWADAGHLPTLVPPQDEWLKWLVDIL